MQRGRWTCRASLGELTDTAVTYGALAASVGATVLAVFTVKAPTRRRTPVKGQPQPIEEDGGFRWAVMGVVSCLPLFSWLVRGSRAVWGTAWHDARTACMPSDPRATR